MPKIALKTKADKYTSQETTKVTSDLTNEMPIKSGSVEETNRYLRSLGSSVYVDTNPQIIRRPTTDRPVTYEQRIMLRCLQPPPLSLTEVNGLGSISIP